MCSVVEKGSGTQMGNMGPVPGARDVRDRLAGCRGARRGTVNDTPRAGPRD